MGTAAPLPVFVHVHVPKTAGTSLNMLLQHWFKERHREFYHPDPAHYYSEEELDALVRNNPDMLSFSSHSVRLFPPMLGGRVALYYCFLREPVDWMISGFTYAKKHYRELSEEHRRIWPDHIESMDFRDFYIYRRDQRKAKLVPVDKSRLVAHPLSRFLCEAIFMRKREMLENEPGLPEGSLRARFESLCVTMSTAVLDSFATVGLTERFTESAELLRQLIVSCGIPAEPLSIPRTNVSSDTRGDLSWINEEDEIGRMVLESTVRDRKVYAYGKAKFERAQQALARSTAAAQKAA